MKPTTRRLLVRPARGLSLSLPQSWAGQMSAEDLKLLLGTLQAVEAWGPAPLTRPVLEDVRLSICIVKAFARQPVRLA